MTHRAIPTLPLGTILHAQKVLTDKISETPCMRIDDGRDRIGEVFVKVESVLPTGSFKIRGATYRLSQLSAEQQKRGVIAYSTGNHAQAVAKAAFDLGIPATIVMSPDVPTNKVLATKRWGASVEMANPNSDDRKALAERLANARKLTLVPPYDDMMVMAGQGTIGLELVDQMTTAEFEVFVPIGGGGLIAGVAAALKQSNPRIKVIGVEPEVENAANLSFEAGRIVSLPGPSNSVADAIKVQRLGDLTFPIISEFVDAMETVSETDILRSTRKCWDDLKLIVEPAGAVGLAAAMRAAERRSGRMIGLLCGGNIELDRLLALTEEAP